VGAVIEVELTDDTVFDTIRDRVDDAGLGLIRLEQRRHHLAEVFLDRTDDPQEAR
jgi:ABC-2 type transport system ATP-binding protein